MEGGSERQTSDLLAVDAHHHLWDPARAPLSWMRREHVEIDRAFPPAELQALLAPSGVASTIVVQSACSDADTDLMLEHARGHDWIAGVVGWVELIEPARAAERLDELASEPKLRGVRHLIHDEHDPHWILQEPVLESLSLLAERGLVLELPAVFPRHLGDVPELARAFPGLTIVIDHLAKPPAERDLYRRWANELADAAEWPNVAAKVSGLDTGADRARAAEVALDTFGVHRLVCGSDWPVSLLDRPYERVWSDTRRILGELAPAHLEELLAGNARRLYSLDGGDGAH
jgi:L-fuconolactonase